MRPSKLPDVGTTIFTTVSQLAVNEGAINLGQGFPDYSGPPELLARLAWHAQHGNNQYPPMAGLMSLRECIAAKVSRLYQREASPEEEITVLPGATEAIFCAITATVTTGDEVIIFDPAYDSYEPAIRLSGGKAVRLALVAPHFAIDWAEVASAVNDKTRMIIINTPHNPSGTVLSRRDLDQLAELTRDSDILIVSDEVYEHLVFDEHRHHSVLSHEELYQRSFAVFSFGKTYHVTGWKTGYCVAPKALTNELRKVHQFVTFVGVSPIQSALADFMIEHEYFSDGLADFYQAKRDLFATALQGSPFKLLDCAGSFFQLVDYSALSDAQDTEFSKWLTCELKVAAIPTSVFYRQPPEQKIIRFCFAKNNETLVAAAERLCSANV